MPDHPEEPPGYPREWEADVLLTDGGVARLRPIRPDDAQLLVEFYDRVSPESKYLRFFAPYPKLSARDVARFTQVDYVDRVALILTVGGQLIAVGRYDRSEDDEAEVAFLVEDAHHGRGIAPLLLEHLAEAARERGITKFMAEVLPQNRAMAHVFADAGYRVSKGIEDGVLLVEFPILPTDTSVGVMERREHRAERASISRLLTPERVVVLGPGSQVQELVVSMLRGGFRGEVIAVSTDSVPVTGVPTADSIAAVDGRIDLALLGVPISQIGGAVIDAAHKGAHGLVVLTGSGGGGRDNATILDLARAYGVRAIGPDALGLVNTDPAIGLNATPAEMPRRGGVGLFCQSASSGVWMLNVALANDLGLSSFISTGDLADVTGNDVMQYWEDDDATRVCLLSLDSIGNPRKFSRIARRLARRKPVVVVAPGRARRGAHTGDRGGLQHAPDSAVDSLFRQSGVMVVYERREMFDIAKFCARLPLPAGPRVTVVTNSHTLATQVQQRIDSAGLLPAGSPQVLPPSCPPEAFAQAAQDALDDGAADSVVVATVGVFESDLDATHAALEKIAGAATKPLITVRLDFDRENRGRNEPDERGEMAIYETPGDAINALAAVTAYAHWLERDAGAVPLLDTDADAGRRIVNRVLSRGRRGGALGRDETSELLAAYGIELVPNYPVRSLAEAVDVAARVGWNVVLKASGQALRGRPDQAGVYRNIDNPEEMTYAWNDLTELVAGLGFEEPGDLAVAAPVVQKMAPPGVAVVVSSREDAAFGPMVSMGLDGIASDLLGDVVYRVPPLTTADAAAMVRDLRAAPVLFGRHGSPGVDVMAVQELLHRVSELADDLPQVAELTLHPCIASKSGIVVLGAQVHIAPTADHRDARARAI